MSIWVNRPDLERSRELHQRTLVGHLGIRMLEVGDDFLRGSLPVDDRTRQPFGILHGGASVVLAETLGSYAANCCVDRERRYCVGQEINANHVRRVSSGEVIGTATAIHLGRRSQVWRIEIVNSAQKLVCESRLTMAVLDKQVG